MVNIGQREAEVRLAYLLFKLLVRLQSIGLADENCYSLPLAQYEFADLLGISAVHVNRVMQSLRQGALSFGSSVPVTYSGRP